MFNQRKMKTILSKTVLCFCIIFIAVSPTSLFSQEIPLKYGITLCGAEFGENNLPGTINVDYTYPKEIDIDYFVAKGVDLIQLPIKWERVQRVLGGPLDSLELIYISNFIDDCNDRKIEVTIVLQNFGKYQKDCIDYVVGESEVTAWHLKDFWVKMADALKLKPNIYAFSLMAEPSDMNSCIWVNTLQYIISGIRTVDRNTVLLIEGNNYSNAATWMAFNDDLKNLQDPSNKLLFNAHCYFDNDFSGRYKKMFIEDGATELTGVDRVKPFVDWLQLNKLNGFVGEFGVPKNDTKWFNVMNNFLEYIHRNNVGGCYWAAGQWWKDYPLSIQPENYNDQPQLILLSKYFNKNQELKENTIQPVWARLLRLEKKIFNLEVDKV